VAGLVAVPELAVHSPAPPARRENDGDRERAVFACVRHPIRKTNGEAGGEIDFLSFCPPMKKATVPPPPPSPPPEGKTLT
jgi:hypothetical protein